MSEVTSFQQTPPAGGRFVCLRSDAISKLVCLELATDPSEQISQELREALTKLTDEGKPLPIWVALDGAIWLSQRLEERERLDAALRFLVMRRANFSLLWRLFKITRQQWAQLRTKLNAPPPYASRIPTPSDADVDLVYNTWHRLLKEYPDEVDRWVLQVQQVPHIPLPCLYKLIYDEGGQS